MPKRRKRRSPGLAAEFGMAGLHTFMTLCYRLPMFAASCASAGRSQPEFSRMVSEKTSAMIEGAWDAQREAMRVMGDAASDRLQPSDLAEAAASVAAAGLRPAFRTVKANSKRLHRRKSRL